MAATDSGKTLDESIAEVTFSTCEMIIAQCYKQDASGKSSRNSITQGLAVRIVSSYDNSYVAYGLITKINNTSLDNIHKPSALGLNFKELAELQPQVYDLLRRELEIHLFAHKEGDRQILCYPPQKPMMIHDFVYKVENNEVLELTKNFSSIINLIKANQLKIDILIDLIMLIYKLKNYDDGYLINTGKELSLAFSDEVEPLLQTLQRLSQSKEKAKASK